MSPTSTFSLSKFLTLAVLGTLVLAISAASAYATPPSIESESASEVTTANAVLEANIVPGVPDEENANPGGAWYQFQLVADSSEFWPEVTCPEQHPESVVTCFGPYAVIGGPPPPASIERRPGDLPTEKLAASTTVQSVSLDLQLAGVALQPGTTYHYRVIAVEDTSGPDTIDWTTPPVYGPDTTFTTSTPLVEDSPLGAVSPPSSSLPIAIGPGPRLPNPQVNKQRCQRKKKVSLRQPSIQCSRAALRSRKR